MQWFIGLLVALVVSTAIGAPTQCPGDYYNNQAPDIVSNPSGVRVMELCFKGFGVQYSEVSNTPLWSAEHLTRQRIIAAHHIRRDNDFHVESRVPAAHRATLQDYYHSGYDRGHMSPSGDMASNASDYDSFSLANMVPQSPDNNRHLWEGIEVATRYMAERFGEIYVVTGPIFAPHANRLHRLVEVPTQLFKAIYVPRLHAGAAYVSPNRPGRQYQTVSLQQLQRMTGIHFFPGAPLQEQSLSLAKPYIYADHHHRN